MPAQQLVELIDEGMALAERVDEFARRLGAAQDVLDDIASDDDEDRFAERFAKLERSSGFAGAVAASGYIIERLTDAIGGALVSPPWTLNDLCERVEVARRLAEQQRRDHRRQGDQPQP